MKAEKILKTVAKKTQSVVICGGSPREVFAAILDVNAMKTFMAEYYSGNFFEKAAYYNRRYVIPDAKNSQKDDSFLNNADLAMMPRTYDTFMTKDNIRPQEIYPLTIEEVNAANAIANHNPVFKQAFAAFQAGISQYLLSLMSANDVSEDCRDDIKVMASAHVAGEISLMHEAAQGASVINELLPVVLSSWQDAGDVSGAGFKKGLVGAYQKSAFKTYRGSPSNPIVIHCPFSKAIAHLFDTVLEDDGHGKYKVAERTEPGALMVFLANRMSSLEAQKALNLEIDGARQQPVLVASIS